MIESSLEQLIHSIKQDSLILFSSHIAGNEDVSFGRFPILSLCYLWNAKSIIRKFSKHLFSIKKYRVVDEDLDSFKRFVSVAGKSLRLYLDDDSMVSPIEMLAVLGWDSYVKKNFYREMNNDLVVGNIVKIYQINGRKAISVGKNIRLSKKILSAYQKRICVSIIALALSFIIILSGGMVAISTVMGLGVESNPFKIRSVSQLEKSLSSSGTYLITKDLVLNENFAPQNFDGVIDGGGHSLYISSKNWKSLVLENSGTIKNLNIVYEDIEMTIDSNFSLLVGKNLGTIKDVNISCNDINITAQKSTLQDIYIDGFAWENSGHISNCRLSTKFVISGIENGECLVSGFVGKNSGTLENLVFEKGSEIETSECDVAGIVSSNEVNGIVRDCKNFATLHQSNSIPDWSPNVAGISMSNYGKIVSSYNYGDLSVFTNSELGNGGNVFLGGISAINYGDISLCYSKGLLDVDSDNLIVYCGGISAYSDYYTNSNNVMIIPTIADCIVDNTVSVETTSDSAFAFVGGFSGYLYGAMSNCYSTSTILSQYLDTKYFVGTCLGLAYIEPWGNVIYLDLDSVVVEFQESTTYVIGILMNSGALLQNSGVEDGLSQIETLSSREQVVQKEGYWYEK